MSFNWINYIFSNNKLISHITGKLKLSSVSNYNYGVKRPFDTLSILQSNLECLRSYFQKENKEGNNIFSNDDINAFTKGMK